MDADRLASLPVSPNVRVESHESGVLDKWFNSDGNPSTSSGSEKEPRFDTLWSQIKFGLYVALIFAVLVLFSDKVIELIPWCSTPLCSLAVKALILVIAVVILLRWRVTE